VRNWNNKERFLLSFCMAVIERAIVKLLVSNMAVLNVPIIVFSSVAAR
jgi:hypothetical protein